MSTEAVTITHELVYITFVVLGCAQPAGSKRAFAIHHRDGTPVMRPNGSQLIAVTDANQKSRSWKNDVAAAAREAYSGDLLRGPLAVEMHFYRPRPAGQYGKNGLNKKGRDTPFPIGRPDVLKLARGVEDACTSVLYADDSQIVEEVLAKRWGEPARVEVVIREIVECNVRVTCD